MVLNYTAEIIMSIVLLLIICIPLIFTIPMWFQHIIAGTPLNQLSINLIEWFGYDGTFWLTLLLGLISFSIGYVYILKMKPGEVSAVPKESVEDMTEIFENEDAVLSDEDLEEEEIAAEDQEDVSEVQFEEIEASLEDVEDDEEEIDDED